MSNQTVDLRAENQQQLVSFFKSGCKDGEQIGLEFEHILLDRETNKPLPFKGEKSVTTVLEKLSQYYMFDAHENGHLIGLSSPSESITLEPTGFLEISLEPKATLCEVEESYRGFRKCLDAIACDQGIDVVQVGYVPSSTLNELELIPKTRYEYLERYLGDIGHHSIYLIRGSASTQVNIDYKSEQDAITKLRVASVLTPLLAFITDNSPYYEAHKNTNRMLRMQHWMNYDPTRCLVAPGLFKKGYGFEDYAQFILDGSAILVPSKEPGAWDYVGSQTFQEAYADRVMTRQDVEHAVSMFFTDCRLKSYIEFRMADAMPIEYALGYAALIKGLFYSDAFLAKATKLIQDKDIDERSIYEAKLQLLRKGYDTDVYGLKASKFISFLFDEARRELGDEAIYLDPLAEVVSQGKVIADLSELQIHQAGRKPSIGLCCDAGSSGESAQMLFYAELVKASGGIPVVLPCIDDPVIVDEWINQFDGFILLDGPDINPVRYRQPGLAQQQLHAWRDALEIDMVQKSLQRDKSLLGVGRGAEIINIALGGTLKPNMTASLGGIEEGEKACSLVRIIPGTELSRLTTHAYFEQPADRNVVIDTLARGLYVNAQTDDGTIKGFETGQGSFMMGIQGLSQKVPSHIAMSESVVDRLVQTASVIEKATAV